MKQLNDFQILIISISLALTTGAMINNIMCGESFAWQLSCILWIFNYYRVAKKLDDYTDY